MESSCLGMEGQVQPLPSPTLGDPMAVDPRPMRSHCSLNLSLFALNSHFEPIFFTQAKEVSEGPQRDKKGFYIRKKKYKDKCLA